MSKEATIGNLKKLVDKLIEEGYCDALLGCNSEYQIHLGEDGMIKYDVFHSKQGITYIDIQP